jgi:hypothetical protein
MNAIDTIDALMANWHEIKHECLFSGNYREAAERWQRALLANRYHGVQHIIENTLHSGLGFNVAVDMLSAALDDGNQSHIRNADRLLAMYARQAQLPVANYAEL